LPMAKMLVADYNHPKNMKPATSHPRFTPITVKEFYNNRDNYGGALIQSCDSDLEKIEYKHIEHATMREIDEDIFCFDTDNGEFCCTGEHYMPVMRNDKKIIIQAKEIKKSDRFFSII